MVGIPSCQVIKKLEVIKKPTVKTNLPHTEQTETPSLADWEEMLNNQSQEFWEDLDESILEYQSQRENEGVKEKSDSIFMKDGETEEEWLNRINNQEKTYWQRLDDLVTRCEIEDGTYEYNHSNEHYEYDSESGSEYDDNESLEQDDINESNYYWRNNAQ